MFCYFTNFVYSSSLPMAFRANGKREKFYTWYEFQNAGLKATNFISSTIKTKI